MLQRNQPNQKRRRGAQPNNRNAFKHGQRSATALQMAKLGVARVKSLALLANSSKMYPLGYRVRNRDLRGDQIALIYKKDPELFDMIEQCGLCPLGTRAVLGPPKGRAERLRAIFAKTPLDQFW